MDNIFPPTCIACRWWKANTAYITSGRSCQNAESESYRLVTKPGDWCDHWEEHD